MNDHSLTVGEVLFSMAPAGAPREDDEAGQLLQETIQKELKSLDLAAINDALLHKLAKILDDPFIDVLVDTWGKCAEILKYRDRTKYPPAHTYLVSLAKHTISSEYRPAIDVFINDMRRGSLQFLVTLTIEVQAFQLEIRDARIRRVRAGTWEGSGEVALEGKPFYRKALETMTVPGIVDLGEGVPIGV